MTNHIDLKYNNFDLLRLFAALQVVFMHTSYFILKDIDNGFILFLKSVLEYFNGVPIFFLISGFLIALSYERNSSIKDYAINRVLRIYPALIVNIGIGIGILYYFGYVKFNTDFFSWLLAQVTIFQFYNAEMFRGFGVGVINGSLWTISVEVTFYLILPFLILLYKKQSWVIFALLLASFLIWNFDLESNKDILVYKLLHVSILPYLFLFIVGILFYKNYNHLYKFIENKFLYWIVTYTVFNTIMHYIDNDLNGILLIIKWVIFSFVVFSFAFSYKEISFKILRKNDFTYGTYIYHAFLINIFVHLKLIGDIYYFLIILILSLFLGVLSWYVVEKPSLRLKKHSIFKEVHKND